MSQLGFVLPVTSIGLGPLTLRLKPNDRGFFPPSPLNPINAQVTIEEVSQDELEITEHPIEQGSPISDHAYKRPAEVIIRCAWSNSPPPGGVGSSMPGGLLGAAVGALGAAVLPTLAAGNTNQSLLTGNAIGQVKDVYANLLELQRSLIPFTIITGKRKYENMLFKSISNTTDINSENALMITATCKEIIVVSTSLVSTSINPNAQADATSTSPTVDGGNKSLVAAPLARLPSGSLGGDIAPLQTNVGSCLTLLNSVPGGTENLPGAVQGALTGVPDALNSVSSTLNGIVAQIPLPFEIPTLNVPQTMSVPIEGMSLSVLSGIIGNAQPILSAAQATITRSMERLPGVVLPSSLSVLPTSLALMHGQISSVTNRITESLMRAV